MITEYLVEFKTGHELNSNGIERLRELIAEAIRPLGVEFLADVKVIPNNIIPGPVRTNYETEEGQDESRSNQ